MLPELFKQGNKTAMGDYPQGSTLSKHSRKNTPLNAIGSILEIKPRNNLFNQTGMGFKKGQQTPIEQSPRMQTYASPREEGSPSRTAPQAAKRSSSVPRKLGGLKYGLSISETVKLGNKRDSNIGFIPNYEMKLWHHDVNKPIIYGIHKELKPRHYLDEILRQKKGVPPPNTYNVMKDLSVK
jgi:hypothetical protein